MRSAVVEASTVVNVIMGQIEGSIPCGEEVSIGWTYDGETFHPPAGETAPEPEPQSPRAPTIVAQARMSVSEDGDVTGIGGDSGLAGAFVISDGYIYVMFTNDQGTDQYIVSPTPIGPYLCYVNQGDQMPDSFALTCTDLAGAPSTPSCIPIVISKV